MHEELTTAAVGTILSNSRQVKKLRSSFKLISLHMKSAVDDMDYEGRICGNAA